jgi:predicted  nucleic acid-binding Zn-ribbon protein
MNCEKCGIVKEDLHFEIQNLNKQINTLKEEVENLKSRLRRGTQYKKKAQYCIDQLKRKTEQYQNTLNELL